MYVSTARDSPIPERKTATKHHVDKHVACQQLDRLRRCCTLPARSKHTDSLSESQGQDQHRPDSEVDTEDCITAINTEGDGGTAYTTAPTDAVARKVTAKDADKYQSGSPKDSGKDPLQYSRYQQLCEATLLRQDAGFAHFFLITQWNMI
ncbi:hypothetical protein L917_20104 [Phytophthora nicotianae]|uniref:Uncharacterized protein n=1 Tax=Phytophthora nicotianae TaxID=4792 RepID=W2K459_PHYNI|nr:hypothetical protein L917_20104 [Phytophthora nicotianae]